MLKKVSILVLLLVSIAQADYGWHKTVTWIPGTPIVEGNAEIEGSAYGEEGYVEASISIEADVNETGEVHFSGYLIYEWWYEADPNGDPNDIPTGAVVSWSMQGGIASSSTGDFRHLYYEGTTGTSMATANANTDWFYVSDHTQGSGAVEQYSSVWGYRSYDDGHDSEFTYTRNTSIPAWEWYLRAIEGYYESGQGFKIQYGGYHSMSFSVTATGFAEMDVECGEPYNDQVICSASVSMSVEADIDPFWFRPF